MNDFIVPRWVFDLLRELPCRWGVAGGWAVDLFLDTVTRDHQDIEVAILREDQQVLRDYLFLAPEIVMLYKSRRFDQPKEQADF